MARKDASFAQLVTYIMRDACDQNYNLHHNLLGRSKREIVTEFDDNAKLLKKRKGANMMYHEVISIKRPLGLSEAKQKAALRDIAEHYIQDRAPDCLVFGGMHDDHDDHLHYHLAMSANPLGFKKRHWLTKAQFRQITVGLERRALQNYPELEQKVSIEKTAPIKLSKKAQAAKARLGCLPKKQAFATDLRNLFRSVGSLEDLRSEMAARNLEFYLRGKAVGVVNTQTGQKRRLKSLGILTDYESLRARLQDQPKTRLGFDRDTLSAKNTLVQATTTGTEKEIEMVIARKQTRVGAATDTISASRRSEAQTSHVTTQNQVQGRTVKPIKRAKVVTVPEKKTDRQIIAEARKAEMEELRKARQKQRGSTLSRTR